ncbi:MAG: hypothetical protein KatS3mg106_472 [Gemmataceae bacterium]|jgi:hypothetical protein|nr:MAG: hypothetical protein KatS3mg106_472 [Gemmataceae bacterium]
MDSQRWNRSTDPYELLEYLFPMRGMDSTEPQPRPSRLYYLACGRRAWYVLPGVCQALLVLGERLYHPWSVNTALRDQLYPLAEELIHARGEAERVNQLAQRLVGGGWSKPDHLFLTRDIPHEQWQIYAELTFAPYNPRTPPFRRIPAEYHSVELLRDVFAPPDVAVRRWIPVPWRTETVRRLAQKAYDSCDRLDFLILADALEEAGCHCAVTLQHLRGKQPHIRGCWVLEWLLAPERRKGLPPAR